MNHQERKALRYEAIDKLADHGIWLAKTAMMAQIAGHIGTLTGQKKLSSQMVTDYIFRWVDSHKPLVNPAYQPDRMRRSDFIWRPQRLADINAGQPPMMTPKGIGNVKQPGGFMPQVWGM